MALLAGWTRPHEGAERSIWGGMDREWRPEAIAERLVYCWPMKKRITRRRSTEKGPAKERPVKEQGGFSVADSEFASRVRESFDRQGLMKHLGAELAELTAGHATI